MKVDEDARQGEKEVGGSGKGTRYVEREVEGSGKE